MNDWRAAAKQRLLAEIEREIAQTASYTGIHRLSPQVREALRKVDRYDFVPTAEKYSAYANIPLPIGYGQTISQPYIVALMTELLDIRAGHKVLEIGTGCGYQAAVISAAGARVYSLEIIQSLADAARDRLNRLGYDQVTVLHADGRFGHPEEAPFDGIIVTAAAPHVPPAVVEQLRPGGRLVIPVGSPWSSQSLCLIEKLEDETLDIHNVLPVAFVPLTSGGRSAE